MNNRVLLEEYTQAVLLHLGNATVEPLRNSVLERMTEPPDPVPPENAVGPAVSKRGTGI